MSYSNITNANIQQNLHPVTLFPHKVFNSKKVTKVVSFQFYKYHGKVDILPN